MAIPRETRILTGSGSRNDPRKILTVVITLVLGIFSVALIYAGVVNKETGDSKLFIAGAVSAILAFLFFIATRLSIRN